MSKNKTYLKIKDIIVYKKNEILVDDNPIFQEFSFDKKLFCLKIDHNVVNLMSDILDILKDNSKEFLYDKADNIYFYKNVFALVVIVNPKKSKSGYSIKIDLNKF